jgi:uncharacterized protein YbdZ (MbtH family)
MLGRIHTSTDHLFLPRLVCLDEKGMVCLKRGDEKLYNLYILGWDRVDEHKRRYYLQWVEQSWKEKFPAALDNRFPTTLPGRYDTAIKDLVFALSHDYLAEVQHFAQLYFMERQRVRHFDTSVREMCLDAARAAIGCAFKLLADCIYDRVNHTWFRADNEIDKHSACRLLMYKFWRDGTGRGLVWGHAEMDWLEESAAHLEMNYRHCRPADLRAAQKLVQMYRRCLNEVRCWERDQDKFWDFMNVKVPKAVDQDCSPAAD